MNPVGGANGFVFGTGGLRVLDLAGVEVAAALGMAGVELGLTVLGYGTGPEGGEIVGVEAMGGFGAG